MAVAMAGSSSYKGSLMATPTSVPSRRTRPKRLLFGVVFAALSLSACGGPGNEEDLVAALTRDDTFTVDQAQCIAELIFIEYGEDEEALGKISGVANYDELTGTDGVDGFDEFFSNTVKGCTL